MNKLIAITIFFAAMIPLAHADQLINDDLIVHGSECVGLDCVNPESFGFDTLRLKENNLRIKFVDTSNTSAFPSNDWQLTANDSNNGGQNYFSIDDVTGIKTPFKLLAGAPDNSVFVNAEGFVGLGTSMPGRQLHINSGNLPSIRLEQNGTGGFTPATWDISANETGLSISTGGNEIFILEPNGDLTITGTLTASNPGQSFPDYVFTSGYQLMPLDQLQNFVSTNSHLPGIPSAGQVAATGINMTELQINLLKKVEELTLYTLQQQEMIGELQQQVRALNGSN